MTSLDRTSGGFSLLEVMGVILVTSMVVGFATDYYIEHASHPPRHGPPRSGRA